MGLDSVAGNKREKMVCRGDRLSTLVKVGGRTALDVIQVTRFVDPGHEAPVSLPQSVAFAADTNVRVDVLQFLLVGGIEDDTLWQGDVKHIASVVVTVQCQGLAHGRCITYKLPGSLPRLISSKGGICLIIRVPLSQSWLPLLRYTTALGGVEMFCE
jgi:hypothetical protein